MNTTIRFIVGLSLLFVIEVVVWTTIIFLVRRWKKVEPDWSWVKTLGAVLLLGVIITGIGMIPVVGRIGALIASLIGVKRICGLDLLSTFILSFCVGVSIYGIAVVIGNQLQT